MARKTANGGGPPDREAGGGATDSCPKELRRWFRNEEFERLPNNRTRGQMPADLARYIFASAFGRSLGRSPRADDFPAELTPNHRNWKSNKFADRYQPGDRPASTSRISRDVPCFIHPDTAQCRSLAVSEAARLQTSPDDDFKGNRTWQYVQVGNAAPSVLARRIAESLWNVLERCGPTEQWADCSSAVLEPA